MIFSFSRAFCLIAALLVLGGPTRAESISLEVHSSSVERDKTTNEMVITIVLGPEAKTAFGNFTERNTGKSMEIKLGSMVLLKARLVEKIDGGIIRANTKFNEDEAKKVADQLTRGAMIVVKDAE